MHQREKSLYRVAVYRMSPMREVPATKGRRTALLLVVMFLLADMALPHTMEGWSTLEEDRSPSPRFATLNHAIHADTHIMAATPNSAYNTSTEGYLNDDSANESRLLLRFPMNYTAQDTILDASIDLQCTTTEANADMWAYTAEMKLGWNGSYASWNYAASSYLWDAPGGDGADDRGEWEPPVKITANGTLSLNVTAMAQHAAKANNSYMSVIVASIGAGYTCHMSETSTPANAPVFTVNAAATPATAGGDVKPDLPVENGAPWMTEDFLLTAVSTPRLSYTMNTGQDVEMHLSTSDGWMSRDDGDWHYSTLWDTFVSTGSSGAFDVPSTDAFPNGTEMFMRIRSIDSNGQWGDWSGAYFLLPDVDVTDNGDGTASLNLSAADVGMVDLFLQDTYVSQTAVTINYASGALLDTSMTTTKERLVHLRLSLNQLGLHDNLTIVDAALNLTRSSSTGDAVVSVHGMDESGVYVTDEVTWNSMGSNEAQWGDGGRSNGTATIDSADVNQSSDAFSFDLTHAVQNYLDDSDEAPLDLMMAVRGKYEGYTNGDGIAFHSSEAGLASQHPYTTLTYKWGDGAPSPVTLNSPLGGLAIWNQTGHNFSGNTQPTLNWTAPSGVGDVLFELARDEDFRLKDLSVDTRVDNDFELADGVLNLTGDKTLDLGNMYFWRMATVDSDGHYGSWVASSFFVSSAESVHLGDDRYEFRMRHGNGSTDGQYPACDDTFIDSGATSDNFDGDSEMTVDYNTIGTEVTALMGCNLLSNLLPDGYAVESAHLRLTLTSPTFNSPVIGVWESQQNNWSAEDATWNSYDGDNSWDTSGAKGLERGSLLESSTLGTSLDEDDQVEWNVTLAVQSAMRDERRVDFIVGIVGAGSGVSRTAYFATAEASAADRPELRFVYVPGSDAVPSNPVPQTPLNGSWSMGTGVDQTPITQPDLTWNFSGAMAIGGYIVEMDTTDAFNSADRTSVSSWNDAGFDVTNLTYQPTSALDAGETWYWRVRAVSATNQIGAWSNTFHFHLPDLTTSVISSTAATVEWVHHEALPNLNVPHFVDTYVIENGSGADQSYGTSSTLRVGDVSGYDAAALMKVPLDDIPQPSNARITVATLKLFSQFQSDDDVPVAVRPVYQNWTASANATTYDGTNNWSERGGRDIGVDIGPYMDLVSSESDAWMSFDISEAVQVALANGENHVSLMIYASTDTSDSVTFTSLEGATAQRPYVNVTWEDGQVASPTTAGVNTAPAPNTIVWDTTSHALRANRQPTMSWTYAGSSTVTDWRVLIQQDAADDMAGLFVYDSRFNASMFDVANRTFTPSTDLDFSRDILWMVQPVNNGMLGPRGNATLFHLPDDIGQELNSTHATVAIQQHNALPGSLYPAVTEDTFLDSGNAQFGQGNNNLLFVGRSQVSYNNANLRTSTLISMNFSNLPMPSNYEVVEASLDLTSITHQGSVLVSVSEMITPWSEASTWAYPAGNTSAWASVGAYQSSDAAVPFNAPTWVNNTGQASFNVTALIQHALATGRTDLNVILQAEDLLGGVNGRTQFASSEHANQAYRPSLNLTYRVDTAPWHAAGANSLMPADGATLWDTSQPRPSGQTSTDFSWSSSVTNQTQWVMCVSPTMRMIQTTCVDSNGIVDGDHDNLTFDAANLTVNNDDMEQGDFWTYWRIRADQNDRIGEWSDTHRFRNPNDQGSDDGAGNHTLNISRGSVFTQTGVVPSVPDVEVRSGSTVNVGSQTTITLGTSSGGSGESRVLMEFDLSSMPWPSAMTPTEMILRLYQTNLGGTSSSTIAAYACSGFSESTTVWSNAPACSTTEITRSTLTLTSPTGWMDWDLTGLAQSNIANGNTTMTIMLARVGTTSSSHTFYSSDYSDVDYRPHLVLDYVDNTAGINPPNQPSLASPNDGEVLYELMGGLLHPDTQPVLSWNPVAGATGYIVTIENETGPVKYKSWENSEITNTTFRFDDDLVEGSQYTWWVQAVNQSIPGPSSSRWSFAVGDPNHVNNGDGTFTYTFQTGNEVAAFGHTNVQDTTLSSANPEVNLGEDSTVDVGTYCGALFTDACRLTVGFDAAQVPLAPYQHVHSASMGMYLDTWTSANGATSMTFSVHPLLGSWSQLSATWNGTTSGSTWGAPGMQAGVDYGDAISTTTVNVGTNGWVWFDLSTPGMTISSSHAWVIIGVPNTGAAHASFYSGEAGTLSFRPQVHFNTTNITTIDITPTGSVSIDADSTQLFQYAVYDHLSMVQSPPITWSASAGSIGSNGLYTPSLAGTHTVAACFGLVCGTQNVTVTPGAPVQLMVTPMTATITADETLTLQANMFDQHGNLVPGEVLTYAASNGSMSAVLPHVFEPYAVGNHTVTVTHPASGEQVVVDVTVTNGAPDYFTLSGCEGTRPAGQWCDIEARLFDQFGNELQVEDAGDLTWTTTNGNYSELNQQYFPDHVGTWWLNLTSTSGAGAQMAIVVGHGEMASLELDASSTSITADERVYINTTRVDVRGNRLTVVLPGDNWTMIADGQITAGAPAIWDPVSRGAKEIQARYETVFAAITVNVVEGEIQTLLLEVDDESATWSNQMITADDALEAEVFARDAKGNQWVITANWSLSHPTLGDASNFLENAQGEATTFSPYYAYAEPYVLTAAYHDGTTLHSVALNITVGHGVLYTVSVDGLANNPVGASGDTIQLSADYGIGFTAVLQDEDENPIDAGELTWLLTDASSGDITDITTALLLNNMMWEATTVGNYTVTGYSISGSGFNISDSVSITVLSGVAVSVAVDASTTTPVAGDIVSLTVTGTDSDGNTFPQNVQWSEAMNPIETLTDVEGDVGVYRYEARVAGLHPLTYAVGSAQSVVEITVAPQNVVARLEVNLSSATVDQLESVEITIRAFDAFDNEIEVPASVDVDATGRADVRENDPSRWTITTLDDGEQTITVGVGSVLVSLDLSVEGNLAGFFEAGGTLYYVGAGLLALAAVVLLGVLVMFMRSNGNEWDDLEDEDDYEDEPAPGPSGPAPGPSGPAPGPSGPAPGPSGPAPGPTEAPATEAATEDTAPSAEPETRTDEDGTEWWEDESGVWWYRVAGEEEWHEWTD